MMDMDTRQADLLRRTHYEDQIEDKANDSICVRIVSGCIVGGMVSAIILTLWTVTR